MEMLKEYNCGYCGYKFEKVAKRRDAINLLREKSQKGTISNQIKCPYCENFLKTWDDGEAL